MLAKTAADLVAMARAHVEGLSPSELAAELRRGDTLLVDLREPEERVEYGHIRGAISVPRGMIEFAADPTSAYHRPEFNPDRRTILYCASGGRSALAADALQQLGYVQVAHLSGGFTAWQDAGLTIEPSS